MAAAGLRLLPCPPLRPLANACRSSATRRLNTSRPSPADEQIWPPLRSVLRLRPLLLMSADET
eukprot:9889586-Lingulodinium_polyedra.AAC.1